MVSAVQPTRSTDDELRSGGGIGFVAAGLAVSLGGAVLAAVVIVAAYFARCGVFFGEDWSEAGTLSAEICGNDPVIGALLVGGVAPPLVGGLVGTARAVARGDLRALTWPLVVGAMAPAAVALVYAVSGFIPK